MGFFSRSTYFLMLREMSSQLSILQEIPGQGIGLLQLTITWYKIRHAGGQAHYYSRTGTSKQRQVKLHWLGHRSLFLCPNAGIIMSLPSSMAPSRDQYLPAYFIEVCKVEMPRS